MTPSYLHGWSPDGQFLVFTGGRTNKFDIYKIPSDGSGPEIRLTDAAGLNDGPEYSPDGKYIYFNSSRTGKMQIWRMKPDGSDQEQITNDNYNNWFPHISPDGKWIVIISFPEDINPTDHPYYKQCYLRLLPVEGGQPQGDRLCLWRAGHDQCSILVAGQPADCLCQQHGSDEMTRKKAWPSPGFLEDQF